MASNPPLARIDGLGRDPRGLALDLGDDAVHAVIVGDQRFAARLVGDLDLALLGGLEEALDQPRPAAPGFEREPAPEHELALVLEGLARIHRRKADALAAHPQEGLLALGDEQFGHVGVAAVIGQPAEIVVIFVGRIGPEIAGRELGFGEVAELQEVVDAVIDKAQRARGITAVAAALVKRRGFEHQNPSPLPARRQRRAHAGIAGPDNDDIELARDHLVPSVLARLPRSTAPARQGQVSPPPKHPTHVRLGQTHRARHRPLSLRSIALLRHAGDQVVHPREKQLEKR